MATLHQWNARARLFFLGSLLAVSISTGATGCGGEPATTPPPSRLHWPPMEGATHYTVRAWSGWRLLFQETVEDTSLTLSANLQRVLAAADSVQVEVKGLAAEGSTRPGEAEAVVGHRRFAWSPGNPRR